MGGVANQAVAILIDQHIQSTDAVYVDFFNRPAATTSALIVTGIRGDRNRGQRGWVYKVGRRAGTTGAEAR